jgi:hypothetical protein
VRFITFGLSCDTQPPISFLDSPSFTRILLREEITNFLSPKEFLYDQQLAVWDTVFERKSALALKESLEKEDPKVIALPRVITNEDIGNCSVHCWTFNDGPVKAVHFSRGE